VITVRIKGDMPVPRGPGHSEPVYDFFLTHESATIPKSVVVTLVIWRCTFRNRLRRIVVHRILS
jgi:hypothetical protein